MNSVLLHMKMSFLMFKEHEKMKYNDDRNGGYSASKYIDYVKRDEIVIGYEIF